MSDQVNRFLGDSVGRTIIKLLVVSLIVGFIMTVFGLTPWTILDSFRDFVFELWHRGFAALGKVGDYLIVGATIVIPIFIIIRMAVGAVYQTVIRWSCRIRYQRSASNSASSTILVMPFVSGAIMP